MIRSPDDDAADAARLPELRHRIFEGSETETLAQLKESLSGIEEDIAVLQTAANSQNKVAALNRLDRIGVELSLMDVRLGELRLSQDRIVAPEAAHLGPRAAGPGGGPGCRRAHRRRLKGLKFFRGRASIFGCRARTVHEPALHGLSGLSPHERAQEPTAAAG